MKIKKLRAPAIAIANMKGGVGKTVSSVNLACSYANMGKKVLFVDADFQGNASSQIGMKKKAQELEKTIFQGLMEDYPVETIMLKTGIDNLYVVVADQEFNEFNTKRQMEPGAHKILDRWLESVRTEFDLIIIDTHPSLDLTFQNVMVAADYYVLPLFAEAESLEGLHTMFKHIEKIRINLKPTLYVLGCFVTKYNKGSSTHQRFLAAIKKIGSQIGLSCLGTIPNSLSFATASEQQIPIAVSRPSSPPAMAYATLAKQLLPEIKPSRRGRTPATPDASRRIVQETESLMSKIDVTELSFDEGASI